MERPEKDPRIKNPDQLRKRVPEKPEEERDPSDEERVEDRPVRMHESGPGDPREKRPL